MTVNPSLMNPFYDKNIDLLGIQKKRFPNYNKELLDMAQKK